MRAISPLSKDSRSMTWHQWQVEYPTERKMGLSSRRAFSNASSAHGYQSTGLCACCCRYGLFSAIRWLDKSVRLLALVRSSDVRRSRNGSKNKTGLKAIDLFGCQLHEARSA